MIKREQYLKETNGLKTVGHIYNTYYSTEDYVIGGKLIRYSWVKKVCHKTISTIDSDFVHKHDMGEYVE